MINLSFILAIDDKFLWFNGLINHAGSMLVDHEKNSQLTSCNNFFLRQTQNLTENCCVKILLPFSNGITLLRYYTVLCRCVFHFLYVVTVLRYYMSMFFAKLLGYYLITLLHDSSSINGIYLLRYYTILCRCVFHFLITLLPYYATLLH